MVKEDGTLPLPLETCWLSRCLTRVGLWFLFVALHVDIRVVQRRDLAEADRLLNGLRRLSGSVEDPK